MKLTARYPDVFLEMERTSRFLEAVEDRLLSQFSFWTPQNVVSHLHNAGDETDWESIGVRICMLDKTLYFTITMCTQQTSFGSGFA